ncbi:hypothetical protein PHYBOEH_008521 [Phytophthora boehmeriae]|uniref:SH3 domain-containing protein n=1 Tax=Phytophthora boehmeriae TaxID=109152 RepID=A0A8T1XFB2_9STRA|nr:hypothetical protein PHYBOEH_008521 [Phytophthora boehmeriae]
MLPALTTKPKQAVRQVQGLSNDSIDSYSNTSLGGGAIGEGGVVAATYVDNTESGSKTARPSPPTTSRSTINTGRTSSMPKTTTVATEGMTMARVVRDRKASGEEELSLTTGDVVKVLSIKRTGYLKCEVGDEVGYVPSSYLEFLDSSNGGGGEANGTAVTDEAQRAAEKQRKKQLRKEKRRKEARDANELSDAEVGAPVSTRSPRKVQTNTVEDEVAESPRKSKKKTRKHRPDRDEETPRGVTANSEETISTARRESTERTDRSRKSKHSKKTRHRHADSSDSSESDGGRKSGRHGRRRRHRRGSSESESDSTYSDDSEGSYRRRRHRRRHRHRKNSSDDDDEEDDNKRRSRRSKKRRDKDDDDSEPDEGSRTARKAEKKKQAIAVQEVEKGVSQLDVKAEAKEKAAEPVQAKATVASSSATKDETDRNKGKKLETERSEGSSEGRASGYSTSRKDDEGRSTTTTSSNKHQAGKTTLGKQIGDKMRSFLGGGKKQNSSKNSSGILNACPGTVQGEEGWYEHGENERYYFVLLEGKWSLLYGPMTEDDFETYSNRVVEQNRSVELPPTYLHKAGYFLNREMRVQKEQ